MKTNLFFLLSFLIASSCAASTPKKPDTIPKLLTGTRVCAIGDGGTGKEDQYNVAKALRKESCDIVLYAGDVVYENGITSHKDKDFIKKFYEPYKDLMDDGVAFYIALGNHDWRFFGNGKHWIEINDRYPKIFYPNYYYADTATPDVCVVSLETNKKDMFKKQIKWWVGEKKQAYWDKCPFVIAFGHHPYYSAGYHGDADSDVKKLLDRTIMGRVDVYIAGHDHNLADEGSKDHTRLFVSGCAGKKRDINKASLGGWNIGNKVGYLVLDIVGDMADFSFKTVEKEKIIVRHTGTIDGKGLRP